MTGGDRNRKALLVLPLCPVYGLGACTILLLPASIADQPALLFILSALAATAIEYLAALFNERILGVRFWSYHGLPGSLHGRVCLPFSLAWGALAVALVCWVHPFLSPLLEGAILPVTIPACLTLAADGLISAALLRRTGNQACLHRNTSAPPQSSAP